MSEWKVTPKRIDGKIWYIVNRRKEGSAEVAEVYGKPIEDQYQAIKQASKLNQEVKK